MTKKSKIDDAMLHAYVDAELDQHAAAEVEAWLARNPKDMARVADWKRQSQELKRIFDPITAEALPPELVRALRQGAPNRWRYWAQQAIAASVLLAAGALGGWYYGLANGGAATSGGSIVAQALSAHIVYVSEVRHPVEVTVDEKAHLIGWLSKRLGQPLSAPDLSATGYDLIGGRLLANQNRPAAQFMYENADGQRITLYVALNPGGQETAFRIASINSTESFYWLDGPLGFAITGDITQSDLLAIARAAYEQLSLPS